MAFGFIFCNLIHRHSYNFFFFLWDMNVQILFWPLWGWILWAFILPVFDCYSVLQMNVLWRPPQSKFHFPPQHWLPQYRLLQHKLPLLKHGHLTTPLPLSLMWLERNGSQVMHLLYYILVLCIKCYNPCSYWLQTQQYHAENEPLRKHNWPLTVNFFPITSAFPVDVRHLRVEWWMWRNLSGLKMQLIPLVMLVSSK